MRQELLFLLYNGEQIDKLSVCSSRANIFLTTHTYFHAFITDQCRPPDKFSY